MVFLGAFILQRLVEELDEMFKNPLTIENKEIDNVIMILSQLYNFKVINTFSYLLNCHYLDISKKINNLLVEFRYFIRV